MQAVISKITKALPDQVLRNQELSGLGSSLTPEKILSKIGVRERRICAKNEFASCLAVRAGREALDGSDIDFLIYCTQSPDYLLPTTACMIHKELGLKQGCGAFDMNLGCSGWVYAVMMANALVLSGTAKRVLVLCADTYSKFLDPSDFSNRSIFGDGATATIVEAECANYLFKIMPDFCFGTDGDGAKHLGVLNSGLKGGSIHSHRLPYLHMNGMEIFKFCMNKVPLLKSELLKKSGWSESSVDAFVLHQASATMLDSLQRKMGIPNSKFVRSLEFTGNTVSSTIPIALMSLNASRVMCLGFGVGLSWAGCLLQSKD